jgi:DNA-binding NtrC family response regulator
MSDRLLVVDDDEAIRLTFRSYFESQGFLVDTAGSIQEATDCLASTEYAAAIVDVCLSEKGTEGLAIAASIRRVWLDMPVVIVTAYGSPQRAAAAARLGVDAFLHKPVSLVWLTSLLRARIASRHGRCDEAGALAGAP